MASVAFSPDGRRALIGFQNGIVRLWDLESNKDFGFSTNTGGESKTDFSPDGRFAYSTGGEGSRQISFIYIWDTEKFIGVRNLKGHVGPVPGLSLSKDGRWILTGGDTSLILWDAQTGRAKRRIWCHTAPIRGVAFLPDSRRAISWSDDATIQLRDVVSGGEIRRFRFSPTFSPKWVALSPDGRRLVSSHIAYVGETFTRLLLWDVETGELLHALDKLEFLPSRGGFSPDGHFVVWGASDGARVYRLQDGDASKAP